MRKKEGISGSILLLLGLVTAITSIILNSLSESNFIVFIVAGVAIAIYGFSKLSRKKRQPAQQPLPHLSSYHPPNRARHGHRSTVQHRRHAAQHTARRHMQRINHPMFPGYNPHPQTVGQMLAQNSMYQNQIVAGYPRLR